MIQTFPLRTSYPLTIREKLSCLMKMAFPTIYQPGQGVYDLNQTLDFKMSRALGGIHWWLAPSGGVDTIAAANCYSAVDPKNAISYAKSLVNLNAPGTNDYYEGTTPTWANGTGWTGNASSMFLKTGITPPQAGYPFSIVFRFSGAVDSSTAVCFGSNKVSTSSLYQYLPRHAAGSIYTITANNIKTKKSSGIISICGTNDGNHYDYYNGIADGSATMGTARVNIELYVLARNNNGIAGNFGGMSIQEIAIYNITLTPAQNLALAIAIAAL